ncbi:MAG: D-amino acid dehydrogenase [Steroidobacterales bacterium]
MRVIVIGAGLAGLTTAYYLRRDGADVTVLERGAEVGLGTSHANGAMLHASLSAPWNSPGIVWQILRWIGREDAPMLLRLRALPDLLGWGLQFLHHSAPRRFEANSRKNLRLAIYSLRLMAQIRAQTPLSYAYQGRGLLSVFRDPAARSLRMREIDVLAEHGLPLRVLERDALLTLEPTLKPIGAELVGGIHYTADEGGDAHLFCEELARVLRAGGAQVRCGVAVDRLELAGRRVRCAHGAGAEHVADAYVLAGGSDSVALARSAGLDLPVRPVKGYSITMPRGRAADAAPAIGIEDTELHAVVVPVGEDRIRVAGTAELAGYDVSINARRIDNLRRLLARLFPRFAERLQPGDLQAWAGLRPMCADGVPLLGETGIGNLYLNTGHGHLGWTLAAGSGRCVADLIAGRRPDVDSKDYALARFR